LRPSDKPSYEFGPFRLDAGEYVLMREGRVIPLSPKLFETLLVLVENSGHVVDKDELYKRVWQEVIVEETNLTKNISILRKILSEGDGETSFIETVPKRGYRFVAPVRKSSDEDSENGSKPVLSLDKKSAVLPFALSKRHSSPALAEAVARQPEFQPFTETDEPAAPGPAKTSWVATRFTTRRGVIIAAALLALTLAALAYVWRWRQSSVAPRAEIKSLAVLPLKSLDASENYLGLGIADAVIRSISQTGKLTVRPTSAVRRYVNEDTDAITAARQLNSDAVLDGNVQRDGDRLRVSVNLLRVSDGVSLWSDNFDMRMADLFTVQDTVAQQVASRLRLQLDAAEQARLNKRSTSNALAYEYYVKGVYSSDQRSFGESAKRQMEATIALFKKAIEADPDYALAHAQLANAYIWIANFIEEQPVWAERAKEEMNRADALDPQLAETHVARHYLLGSAYEGWKTEAAVRELLIAQKLNPNVGHVELGSIYYHLGLEDLGDRAYQRALEIDPTSEHIKYMIHAHIRLVNKYDEWLAAYQKFNRDAPMTPWYLMGKGRLDEAQKKLDELSVKYRDEPAFKYDQALLAALKGEFRTTEADVAFMLSDANPQAFNYHHSTYDMACLYALGGKSAEAVKWLRETATKGFPSYTLFARDPYLNRIRQAPEFVQFMQEMKAQHERFKREFQS